MRADTDIAILGAGCAGLSLAVALGIARVPGQITLLEPRTAYTRDRTWCFWNTEEHPFTSSISQSWNSWRVCDGAREALNSSRRYRYCHIAGDDFYRTALERIRQQPDQELYQGVTVHHVAPHTSGLLAVETSAGRLLARQVFDSRPPAPNPDAPPALLQRFLGWHVRAGTPCFHRETVDLMRFLPADRPGRTRFVYVLPYSATEALVEMTYLDDPQLPEPPAEADLRAWLAEHCGPCEVLYREHGTLPMGLPAPSSPDAEPPSNLHRIGAAGGRLKPSSGYGFLRIQRHSRAIAHALRTSSPASHALSTPHTSRSIPNRAEPRLYSLLDAVFLAALREHPAQAPSLFLRMFARADSDALVRFLSEASDPAEMLRVALSLPILPMLNAALAATRTALTPGPATQMAARP